LGLVTCHTKDVSDSATPIACFISSTVAITKHQPLSNSHSAIQQSTPSKLCLKNRITHRRRLHLIATMLLPRIAAPLLVLALSSPAHSSFFDGSSSNNNQQSVLLADELSVPGKNPLKFCQPPYDYILDIQQVDLSPNPPEA
jgi:hypothetical protein